LSKLTLAILVGYGLGLPVLLWMLRDLRQFHRPIWVGYGNRGTWRHGAVAAYLLGGWPVIMLAVGWRTGRTRAELVDELERLH
jgi:hypothetical protein